MLKLNAKEKFMVGFTILCTVLLTCALACTVVLAAFTANKQATTTIRFHSGITLTLTGVTNSQWQYKCDNTDDFGITGTPLKQLDLSPITATFKNNANVDSATTVYVRVFVVLTTSNSNGTLPAITGNSTYTSNNSELKTSEKNFITDTSLMLANTSYAVETYSTTTGANGADSATATIINSLNIFTATTQGDWNGAQVKAYFRVYASLTSGQWDESVAFTFG